MAALDWALRLVKLVGQWGTMVCPATSLLQPKPQGICYAWAQVYHVILQHSNMEISLYRYMLF